MLHVVALPRSPPPPRAEKASAGGAEPNPKLQAPRRRRKKPSYRGLENKDPPPTHPRGDSKEPRRRLPRNGSPQGTPDMAICVGEPRGRRASPCETVINREKDRNKIKKKVLIKHMSGFETRRPVPPLPLLKSHSSSMRSSGRQPTETLSPPLPRYAGGARDACRSRVIPSKSALGARCMG